MTTESNVTLLVKIQANIKSRAAVFLTGDSGSHPLNKRSDPMEPSQMQH